MYKPFKSNVVAKRRMCSLYACRMNSVFFFDVETTGTDRVKDRIVQIAWILSDPKGQSLIERCYILKPDNFEIPYGSSKIHRITTSIANTHGVARLPVFEECVKTAVQSTALVAHNVDFDIAFLRSECNKLGLSNSYDEIPQNCTMKASTEFCGLSYLNGRSGLKWPRLEELHYKLFGTYFSGAHDALIDVQITKKCYFELRNRGIL